MFQIILYYHKILYLRVIETLNINLQQKLWQNLSAFNLKTYHQLITHGSAVKRPLLWCLNMPAKCTVALRVQMHSNVRKQELQKNFEWLILTSYPPMRSMINNMQIIQLTLTCVKPLSLQTVYVDFISFKRRQSCLCLILPTVWAVITKQLYLRPREEKALFSYPNK